MSVTFDVNGKEMAHVPRVGDARADMDAVAMIHGAEQFIHRLPHTARQVLAIAPGREGRVIPQGAFDDRPVRPLEAVDLDQHDQRAGEAADEQDLEPERGWAGPASESHCHENWRDWRARGAASCAEAVKSGTSRTHHCIR